MTLVPIGPGRYLNLDAVEELYDDGETTCVRTVSGHCTRITSEGIATRLWTEAKRPKPRRRGLLARLLAYLRLYY